MWFIYSCIPHWSLTLIFSLFVNWEVIVWQWIKIKIKFNWNVIDIKYIFQWLNFRLNKKKIFLWLNCSYLSRRDTCNSDRARLTSTHEHCKHARCNTTSTQKTAQFCLNSVRAGGIILVHFPFPPFSYRVSGILVVRDA